MNFKILHITIMLILGVGVLSAQRKNIEIPKEINLSEFPQLSESILQDLENHGYPFATVRLESIDNGNGNFMPKIIIDSNLFITFDSIVIKGDVKLSRNFLYAYLGLKRGTPYNEKIMQSVVNKLAELPYSEIAREPGVAFVKDKAYLYVYLNKRNTNQFDGYIGLVPMDERSGKVRLTGELTLALQNLFKIGEQITLNWHSSAQQSQYLQASARFPHLYRSRFGISGKFELDKQDTSYLTLNYHLGIPYTFLNNSYIEPYFNHISSHILSTCDIDSDTLYGNYNTSLYGLQVNYRHLDYLFNPRKGIDIAADLSAGMRKSEQSNEIDAKQSQQTAYRLQGSMRGYVPIGKHFVITPSLRAGSLIFGNHYDNELFNISDNRLLRGFNPNDIRATTYLLYSAEFRYLFAQKSFANLFFDGAVYELNSYQRYLFDTPFSFGAGIHLAVKSGIFYIEYALGRQLGNPILLKAGKIHFGINVEF